MAQQEYTTRSGLTYQLTFDPEREQYYYIKLYNVTETKSHIINDVPTLTDTTREKRTKVYVKPNSSVGRPKMILDPATRDQIALWMDQKTVSSIAKRLGLDRYKVNLYIKSIHEDSIESDDE